MNLQVIIGTDDFLVERAARKVIGDGQGLEVIDSRNSSNAELQLRDIAAALEAFLTPPFLEPRKVTWWRNVHFLPSSARKKGEGDATGSEAVKEALKRFADKVTAMELPENQKFVLSGPSLMSGSVFAKTLAKVAEMIVFPSGRPADMRRAAAASADAFAAELGLSFAPGVRDRFVDRVGTDGRSLYSELGKLRDYIGQDRGEVRAEDVDEITSQGVGVEPVFWNVTDAVGRRDLAATLEAIRPFELEKGFGVLMTTVLAKFFRELSEYKDAERRGRLDAALDAARLAPFLRQKVCQQLRNWTAGEVRAAWHRMLRLRERVVTSSGAADTAVLSEIVRIMRRGV